MVQKFALQTCKTILVSRSVNPLVVSQTLFFAIVMSQRRKMFALLLTSQLKNLAHLISWSIMLAFQGLLVLTSVRRTYQSLRSVAGAIGGLGPHAYTGSKHAVLGLNKNVAAELGKYGIRVNCVSPYAVATGLALAHLPEEERTEDAMVGFRNFVARNANMQGTELTANDVANAVLFLASDEARYISGTNLMVDGGFTSVNHSLRVFR
ncbi:hypothetical protein CICLE_v10012415mg [Citrus x clementina]|uniref:Xanthoxin dehydrogenase n=1 Tax=Citrus clementina TaxID=85681 RepID=V4UPQ7_CITCL|nr:hypothetical protein CICLE_v10012415mg [Citrus x clementina]ESR41489.1 hypothetical protein CICLE_v10012415mg [Citrus x clementina]ESR41490.1 hypothetical protein CICLE_v10012415mg [Citrus x clementina]ESR41492.1 hypothetical protein CICLE_v10012415mg [Citrus x clementina]ESR41495.1 hypothetical protein CICLE_v10012415mg [Citrus x clementina]